jgi:spore coat-associated protein N
MSESAVAAGRHAGASSLSGLSAVGKLAHLAIRWRGVTAGIGLLTVGVSSAVIGTMSTFTSTQTKTQTVASGTFVFNVNDPGAGSVFSTAISGLAPGDFGDRLVTLVNTGSINFASVGIGVTATTSSLLDTDATNGLSLAIDKCSVAWTQASNTVGATCSGTTTSLTTSTPVPTLKTTGPSYTTGLSSLTGGTDYLRFHYSLPSGATGVSGLSSTLSYAFTATQAAGGAYH